MAERLQADLCIIGAGSGGLSVAAGAVQLGRNVILLEKGAMGGDCLNYGCVPSKALLAAAAQAQAMRAAGKYGVTPVEPEIDFAAVMDHVRAVIAAIAPHDSQQRFEDLGVTVIRERGEFTGPRTVKAGTYEISAKHIVIAAGSSPTIPPIPGLDRTPYFTNETIFANRVKPRHLIVIGGGPIGVELAQAHKRLGSAVTLIEARSILNREDPDAVAVVRAALVKEGVDVKENANVEGAAPSERGVAVSLDSGQSVEGSHLLVAVGRRANVSGLGLECAGIETTDGKLKLDARLRTTNKRVYAIGDAAGELQFTHVAGDHASTVIRNILFKTPAARRDHLAPRVTYCDPELASVGLTEKASAHGRRAVVAVQWPFKDNDRAQTEQRPEGFLKIFVRKNGTIAGATAVGAGAGDIIGLWAFAVANGMKIRSMTKYIAPYPSRGEISKRAAGAFYTPTLYSDVTRALVRLLSILD